MDKINAKVYLTVASTGSFRKAADLLGYTQAGISYIISAMETETGLNLFVRDHGGVHLSAEGEALLPMMQQLEGWEHQFNQTVNELKGLEKGTLRIQIFDSISVHWLPGILRDFKADYPGIKIELITEEDSIRAEQMVLNGEVDCGFFLTGVRSALDYYELIEENLLAVVSPDHPMAEREHFPIDEIGNYPYIAMKYDPNTGIRDIFTRKGVEPQTEYCMDNDYAAMAMVENGLGYCIFAELLVKNVPFDLKTMEFDEPQKRVISIGTASLQNCSMACKKFIEYTLDWVEKHTGQRPAQ